jgi:hypothetical protein
LKIAVRTRSEEPVVRHDEQTLAQAGTEPDGRQTDSAKLDQKAPPQDLALACDRKKLWLSG